MLPFKERLEQFGQQTTASIDELIALIQSAPVMESTVAAQAVIVRYGRLVTRIGELAVQNQLSGVNAVCALVETNLLLLQDDKRPLTPEESGMLEAWPMLLLGYLANQADRDASSALLQNLAEYWPITLPLESVTDELRLLIGENEPGEDAVSGDSQPEAPSIPAPEPETGATATGTGVANTSEAADSKASSPEWPGTETTTPEVPEAAMDSVAEPVISGEDRPSSAIPEESVAESAASPFTSSLDTLTTITPEESTAELTMAEEEAAAEEAPLEAAPEAFSNGASVPEESESVSPTSFYGGSLDALITETPETRSDAPPSESTATETSSAEPSVADSPAAETPLESDAEMMACEEAAAEAGFGEAAPATVAHSPRLDKDETEQQEPEDLASFSTSMLDAFIASTPEPAAEANADAMAAEEASSEAAAVQEPAPEGTASEEITPAGVPEEETAEASPDEDAVQALSTPLIDSLSSFVAERGKAPDEATTDAAAVTESALDKLTEEPELQVPDVTNAQEEPALTDTGNALADDDNFVVPEELLGLTHPDFAPPPEELTSTDTSAVPETAEEGSEPEAGESAEGENENGGLPPANGGTQHVALPMLRILLEELNPLNEAFESVIAESTQGSDEERRAALVDLIDFMERLKVTVETIGLTALAALLARFSSELASLPGGLAEHHRELLRRLPRSMMAYLQTPDAPAASAGLVILLADTRWNKPLAGSALAAWRAALADIELSEAASQEENAEKESALEDMLPAFSISEDNSADLQVSPTTEAAHDDAAQEEVQSGEAHPDEPADLAFLGTDTMAAASAESSTAAATAPEAVADENSAPAVVPELPAMQDIETAAPAQPAFPAPAEAAFSADYEVAADEAVAQEAEIAPAEFAPAESTPEETPVAAMPAESAADAIVPEPAAAHRTEPTLAPPAWAEPTSAATEETEISEETPPLPLPETRTQQVERPMINILLDELQPLNEEFSNVVSAATRGSLDDRMAALGELLDFLERVKTTVEAIGLTALSALLAQVGWEIISLPDGLDEQHGRLLQRLPEAMSAYLQTPDGAETGTDLVALIADPHWHVAATDASRAAWCAALADIELSETCAQLTPARPTEATAEDVSLALPEEVNPELLDGLLQELPVQVSAFTTAVASITGGHGTLQDTEQAMRAAHTLKGAANTVGIPGIANLTHHLEDILLALKDEGRQPQGKLADMLIDAGDCLEAMSESLLGLGPAPEDAQDVLQQVLNWANRLDSEGLAELLGEPAEPPAPQAATPVPAPGLQTAAAESVPATRTELPSENEAAEQRPQPQAGSEQSLRVPAPLVDELLSLAGESLISNSQLQDHLRSSITQNQAVHQQHQLILKLVSELETLVDIRGITSQQQAGAQEDDFDTLEFEHYNELQTISRQLVEATTDAREMSLMAEHELDALNEVLGDQQRLQMANQRTLLRTRMMPVSNIIPRLQRSVRQTGRLLDKPVEFTIRGENTSMDTNVLNDLMDPLMHLLRNAVDHGIEKPEARIAAGKSAEGHIELSFAREGDTIVVRCKDDGAGLDHEAIRSIAESKGMIIPGHIHTEDELSRLILMPGFSTRNEASQVSGRGVGMDVVYSRVQEMKGMLALNSVKGKGLTIELRLPATLVSMHALIIRQRERRLAISTRGIEDIRYIAREDITEIGARQFVRDGDKLYALLRLEQILSMPADRRAKDRSGYPVLLLRMEDGSERAVLVQEVLESREVVMKKFNRFVPQLNGVIGGAILGNGEVAPVIDMYELLHAPLKKFMSAQRAQVAGGSHAAPEEKPKRALVVDDSLSARRAVVQLLKDEGYEIRTANDGLEAVNILEKWIPDIIISDMEMPRMNGLELTSNIRHSEQTKDVPVIMITSRSTAKHRQMSAAAGVSMHMIKPFSDDELVQQVSKLVENAQ